MLAGGFENSLIIVGGTLQRPVPSSFFSTSAASAEPGAISRAGSELLCFYCMRHAYGQCRQHAFANNQQRQHMVHMMLSA